MANATTNQPTVKPAQVLRSVKTGDYAAEVMMGDIIEVMGQRNTDWKSAWYLNEQERKQRAKDHEMLVVATFRQLKEMCKELGLDPDTVECMTDKPYMDITSDWFTGEVKVFFDATDRMYGFTKDSVHFHWNRGVIFKCDGSDFPVVGTEGRPSRVPKRGDRIVYTKFETPRGLATGQWGLEENWLEAKRECDNRVEYRIMRNDVRHWQGKNIGHMRLMYPAGFSFAEHGYVCQKLVNVEKTLAGSTIVVQDWADVPDPR